MIDEPEFAVPTPPAAPTPVPTPPPTAPATSTYTSTEYHVLFDAADVDFVDVRRFSEDPFFRGDNSYQASVTHTIARAPGLPYLVAFRLYHAPADEPAVTDDVRDLARQYGGRLDGEMAESEPEPEPEPAPARLAMPWR